LSKGRWPRNGSAKAGPGGNRRRFFMRKERSKKMVRKVAAAT
jgi:hypothetical protein